ncbi:sigma-70 family RNA polymerase sigma factor [Dyadobacter psychrotolerans]|uniref:Sigma-70 family RNA polymerase sigma factor n=1 Tax=Dyadobacter psychrotolerans TaxID=2541721 RepID=A0A4R5DC40_9BACT|nr:sigma-70 family RNA polymerase sigma factor [Dyadobacter psychrotolerans]
MTFNEKNTSVVKSDADLWEEFKNGEWQAFEQLLESYYRPLYQYGRKFTTDDQVKDLIHDLFLHLWDYRSNLPEVNNLKAYLFTSLRNRIFKNQKVEFLVFPGDHFEQSDPSDQQNIERNIIATETSSESQQRVNRIIGSLTRRQQEIIHLKFFQNLSNNEIASVMEISPPAVSNLLYHTLRLFKEKWALILLISLISIDWITST